LPGDKVQVALLFGEEVVEREPRQYLLQSVSHRPLDQLEAESFVLVCVLVGRQVDDTRGAKKLLAGQDHVEHVSGFEVGGDVGEDLVGHVAERGRGGLHLLGGRIHACARLRYDSDTITTRPISRDTSSEVPMI
jgi:hypothetical protein